METVRLSTDGRRIQCNPVARLGSVRFTDYRDATSRAGARFDKDAKCQIVPPDKLADCVMELRNAGFAVEVDEHLAERLKVADVKMSAKREAARELHDAAIERMDSIDAALAERGLALYPYQRDGVRWLSHRNGAGLFDEMGLGKTVQALIAAPEGAPILVVAPAAVKGVWSRETRRWRPDLGFPRVLSGRGSFRWPAAGEIVVTNYDILPEAEEVPGTTDRWGRPEYQLPEWVPDPKDGTVVVFDECHMLKSPRAKRTKVARLLAARTRAKAGFVWGLTGTPLLNRPKELWDVLVVMGIAKEAYGDYRQFSYLFDAAGNPRPDVANRLQKVSLMRRRLEVLPDLPVKTYREITVEIDEDTRRLADELQAKLEAAGLKLAEVQDVAEIVAATKHARLSIGEISRVRAALAKAKTGRLVEIVEEFEAQDKPVVVFSAHRGPVDMLATREDWLRVSGDETGEDRTGIVAQFAAGQSKGIACTIRAAGVGIDGLQRASHNVIFCDLDWTPGWNAQAEDRVCRIGQDRGVVVTTLIADHALDEKLTHLLARKARIIEGAVNASARETVEEQFPEAGTGGAAALVKVKTAAEMAEDAIKSGAVIPLPVLWTMFRAVVRTGIARPTLTMGDLELHVSGTASKYAGQIQVTNGFGYGHPENLWYGRIDSDGLHRSRACPEAVVVRLKAWNDDPDSLVAEAKAYGHRTGCCCFCSTKLTTPESVTAGYGPICAERWGLPWGEADDITVPLDFRGADR